MDLTKESFDLLLAWLDPDRDQAAKKYEEIRKTLIQIFTWRNLSEAEDLADETINRVARRSNELVPHYTGDPSLYFYGVAKNLILEQVRRQGLQASLEDQALTFPLPADQVALNVERECLTKCLDDLPHSTRELVLKYYTKERQRKIDYRKALADRLGINANALRVRMHRLRADLHSCVEKCVNAHGVSD